jgi:site-specific recombinase XerD
MYNSGARVSEIIALVQDQVCFGSSTFLHLKGKGRKERSIPLWPHTAQVLKSWFHELQQKGGGPLAFPNARGACLSRDGVDYLLRKAVQKAALNCFSLNNKRVSCHVIRHSTAMHLLQAGVDIAVIALWLGHESIQTTHMYVEADLATKERALQKVAPVQGKFARFKADDALMQFLNSL